MIPRRFWSRMGTSYSPSNANTVKLAALRPSNVAGGLGSISSLGTPRQPPVVVGIFVMSTSTSMRGRALAKRLSQDARRSVFSPSQRRRLFSFDPIFFFAFLFSCCLFDSERFRLPNVDIEPFSGRTAVRAVVDEDATGSGAAGFRGMALRCEEGGCAGRGRLGRLCFLGAAGLAVWVCCLARTPGRVRGAGLLTGRKSSSSSLSSSLPSSSLNSASDSVNSGHSPPKMSSASAVCLSASNDTGYSTD